MKENWKYKKLGEIATFTSGSRPAGGVGNINEGVLSLGGEHIGRNGHIDLSSPKYVTYDYYNENKKGHIVENDILLCKDGALTGKVAILRGELSSTCSMVNEHVFILRAKSILQWYLFYFLYSHIGQLQLKIRIKGAAQGGLNGTNLKTISIPVPPLPIQRQIVAELDLLSDIIEKQKQQIAELDKLAQATFYDMFGDPVTNEKGWEVKRLEHLCVNIVDCPHTTPVKSDHITEYPCIRTSELKNGVIKWDSMQYLERNEYLNRIARLEPLPGDIVFGREGSIGDAVVLPEGFHFSLGQRTMLLRMDKSIIDVKFMHQVLMSEWVKNQIKAMNVSSTVAHLNIKDFRMFDIPVPPLPLQQSFASRIEAIERQKELISNSIKESQKLFDSRMEYWFG